MNQRKLTGDEVRDFLTGRKLKCFDPESGTLAATIEYHADGTCHAVMADGATDHGRYGFENDFYWTRYSWFRDGGLFRFHLHRVDEGSCQAYFDDGTRAFLQVIDA